MDMLQPILECLIVDNMKMMEFQQIFPDVVSKVFLDRAVKSLQQAIPSRVVALRAPIYLDFVHQCDALVEHHQMRN